MYVPRDASRVQTDTWKHPDERSGRKLLLKRAGPAGLAVCLPAAAGAGGARAACWAVVMWYAGVVIDWLGESSCMVGM